MTLPIDDFIGKRNSAKDQGDIQAAHDTLMRLGAKCSMTNTYHATIASDYLIESYTATRPGDPYRLFAFGEIVKNGKRRVITPEYAARFKVPHFKPPIKLGSHDDVTPAGGHIVGLEVRADGLWAVPEINDNGAKAIGEGHYRYHSPEVIWDDGGIELPDGKFLGGPLIVGDALLHTPHLGENSALYAVAEKEPSMTTDMVSVPLSWFDKLMGRGNTPAEPAPVTPEAQAAPAVDVEKFNALQAQAEQYKAEIENMKAQAARAERVDKFTAAVKATKAEITGLPELLADLSDEKAELILTRFRALSAQIDESALTAERGRTGAEVVHTPAQALDAVVNAKMQELKITYGAALDVVKAQNPELVRAYEMTGAGKGK